MWLFVFLFFCQFRFLFGAWDSDKFGGKRLIKGWGYFDKGVGDPAKVVIILIEGRARILQKSVRGS